jgi:2-polyprenyl-3-methyl-5-hydroxy-6-metoxy-1,4-benzoquinol methylase
MDVMLNLGCGNSPMQGAVNLDRMADVIEHLPDTVATMEEISRVCAPGALVHITTPHFSCANAFTDPTHLHQLGYLSFEVVE